MLFVDGSALAAVDLRPDYHNIFAHEDIRIEAGQTIGLLVTGGNATVDGVVEKGVVVVDGNLFLTPGAHIKGVVVVLGGYVKHGVVAGYTAGAMWLAFCISLLMWWERERLEKAAK